MQIAIYEKNVNGEMVEEVGTEAFLNAGAVRNCINYENDVRAMRVAAVNKFVFAEYEATFGHAPREISSGPLCPGTNGF